MVPRKNGSDGDGVVVLVLLLVTIVIVIERVGRRSKEKISFCFRA